MSFNSISSKRLIKLFLFFSFLICWLSVSTSFEDLLIFQKSQQYDYDDLFRWDLNNVINFFRHFLVYFCFLLLILLILLFRKDFFFQKKYNFSLLFRISNCSNSWFTLLKQFNRKIFLM